MILIRRTDSPTELANNPENVDRYNHDNVVAELAKMQHRKCCYCESDLPKKGLHKHVEHIKPKGKPEYEELRNDWENLLLVCGQCNGSKKEKYPLTPAGDPLLVDPSKENPEDHITFHVDMREEEFWGHPIVVNDSKKGSKTIEILKLYDSYYIRMHRKRIREMMQVLFRLQDAEMRNNGGDVNQCKAELNVFMKADSTFAAVGRAFVRDFKLDNAPREIRVLVGAER